MYSRSRSSDQPARRFVTTEQSELSLVPTKERPNSFEKVEVIMVYNFIRLKFLPPLGNITTRMSQNCIRLYVLEIKNYFLLA